MANNLDDVIKGHESQKFKSEGERRIAYFLDENSIRYQYEPGVLINSVFGKQRIWYPDFHLPEFASYIEYFGLAGKRDYDKGIKTKEAVYSKMGLDVIPVYPWMFSENWHGYIMKELKHRTIHRYRKLMSKPYWSKRRNSSIFNTRSSHHHYRQGVGKQY